MKKQNLGLLINEEKVTLAISNKMNKADLQQFSKKLKEEEIYMDFSKSTFDEKGNIEYLDITIGFDDGGKGNFKASWLTLQLFDFGFEKYKIEDAPYSFRVGKM